MHTSDGKRIEMMSDREIERRYADALRHPDSPAAILDAKICDAEQRHRDFERAPRRPVRTRPAPARDFSDVRGMSLAILHTVIAAARSHLGTGGAEGAPTVLLFNGAPGTGKTMIAARVAGALPAMTEHERAWIVAEYEGAGVPGVTGAARPFRAPHHTISQMALVGEGPHFSRAAGNSCRECVRREGLGMAPDPFHLYHTLPRGPIGRVGELELARHGVLFLDELIEFRLAALEALGRAWRDMAGRPLIVAAVNPCPCGWAGSSVRECTCSPASIERYRDRLAKALGALVGAPSYGCAMFRADVAPLALGDMRDGAPWPTSAEVAAEIGAAS